MDMADEHTILPLSGFQVLDMRAVSRKYMKVDILRCVSILVSTCTFRGRMCIFWRARLMVSVSS